MRNNNDINNDNNSNKDSNDNECDDNNNDTDNNNDNNNDNDDNNNDNDDNNNDNDRNNNDNDDNNNDTTNNNNDTDDNNNDNDSNKNKNSSSISATLTRSNLQHFVKCLLQKMKMLQNARMMIENNSSLHSFDPLKCINQRFTFAIKCMKWKNWIQNDHNLLREYLFLPSYVLKTITNTIAIFMNEKWQWLVAMETVWPDGQIDYSIFGHLQQWKFNQKAFKLSQSGFTTLPNTKYLPKISQFLLKWWNFAKSGHTVW